MLSTLPKIALLTSLYFAQGLPFGFFTQAFPVILRQRGASLEEIGLAGLLSLPWALKFLWSPWVDRLRGSPLGPRRGWILPLQLAFVLVLVGISQMDIEHSLFWVGVGFFALNLIAATQDIATDGLAVQLLSGTERGLGNGVQVGGYRLGMIVGGGFLLVLFEPLGWSGAFLVMAALMTLATLPILRFRETAVVGPVSTARPVSWGRTLLAFARRPGALRWAAVLCAFKAGDALASGMVRPFLVDLGLGVDDVGWLLGTAGSTAALLGAGCGGLLLTRMTRRQGLLAFGVMQLLSVAVWIIPASVAIDRGALYAISIFENFAGSLATVALFTAMMDACDPRQAGTDYTLQACLVVVATGVFSAFSGFSAHALGFAGHFELATVICLVGLVATAAWTKRGLLQGE